MKWLNIYEIQKTLMQVRELKAALDTKQGNVSPDTLLALLEAANQEVGVINSHVWLFKS